MTQCSPLFCSVTYCSQDLKGFARSSPCDRQTDSRTTCTGRARIIVFGRVSKELRVKNQSLLWGRGRKGTGWWGCRARRRMFGTGKKGEGERDDGVLRRQRAVSLTRLRPGAGYGQIRCRQNSPSRRGSGLPAAPVSGGPALPGNAPSSRQRLQHTACQVRVLCASWRAFSRASRRRRSRTYETVLQTPSSARRGHTTRDLSVVCVFASECAATLVALPTARMRSVAACRHDVRALPCYARGKSRSGETNWSRAYVAPRAPNNVYVSKNARTCTKASVV